MPQNIGRLERRAVERRTDTATQRTVMTDPSVNAMGCAAGCRALRIDRVKGYSSFALNFGGIGAAAGNHEAKSMLSRVGEGEACGFLQSCWGGHFCRPDS